MDFISSISQARPASESFILSQTESEFARDRKAVGDKIIENKGRFWRVNIFRFLSSSALVGKNAGYPSHQAHAVLLGLSYNCG